MSDSFIRLNFGFEDYFSYKMGEDLEFFIQPSKEKIERLLEGILHIKFHMQPSHSTEMTEKFSWSHDKGLWLQYFLLPHIVPRGFWENNKLLKFDQFWNSEVKMKIRAHKLFLIPQRIFELMFSKGYNSRYNHFWSLLIVIDHFM